MERVSSLDWLRGILALSVMAFHLIKWLVYLPGSEHILGRLGIYAVTAFFVLSGLSMAIVYDRKIVDVKSSLGFYVRRVFRIWPLLWVVLFLFVIHAAAGGRPYAPGLLFINFTTLFGFIKPDAYINSGAWSIGNEMVYYALTPLILLLFNKQRWAAHLIYLCSLLAGLVFSSYILTGRLAFYDQWSLYINPFNNFFTYMTGIYIYYFFSKKSISPLWSGLLILLGVSILLWYPAHGDLIHIVIGAKRFVFCLAVILIVVGTYKCNVTLPKMIRWPLEQFGLATYGIYITPGGEIVCHEYSFQVGNS